VKRFGETLYDAYGQEFRIDALYCDRHTAHQQLSIFHNALYGRVMALDGIVQLTERDAFIYHEMLVHLPVLAHGQVRRVLLLGGGDGAALAELCRYSAIESIDMVELDGELIELCRQHLPMLGAEAWQDPRLSLHIAEGLGWLQRSDAEFDLIIADVTDPVGPGAALFSEDFYDACRQRLAPGGLLVAQNGVGWLQLDQLVETADQLAPRFADWHFFSAAVPSYIGGNMNFAWASDDASLRQIPAEQLADRQRAADIETRYYTAEIHRAAFALPRYLLDAIGK
jgi:spermidine synthase